MTDMNHPRTEFGLAGVENGEYLIAIGGYKGYHLDTYEMFHPSNGTDGLEGTWTYGKPRMENGLSRLAMVTVPGDLFPGECE